MTARRKARSRSLSAAGQAPIQGGIGMCRL
jgi:hypothetical protein